MDKHISRQFFNEGAAHWDEEARIKNVEKMRAMADRLEIPPFATVLDVGTGTGVFVPFLQTKLADSGRIICLDFAFLMLEKAVVKHGNQRVDYVCGEIETTIFRRGYFDVIVCYSTFPHFHDKPIAMRNMHALLRKAADCISAILLTGSLSTIFTARFPLFLII